MTTMIQPTWKMKLNTPGVLIARHDGKKYEIQSITATTFQLSVNDKPILKGTKEACKSHVLDLINRKPVPTITADMLKPSKGGVITWKQGTTSGMTSINGEKGLLLFVLIYQPAEANWSAIHNSRTLWTGSIDAVKKVCETVVEKAEEWMREPKPKSKPENVLAFLTRAARHFGHHPSEYVTSEAMCNRAKLNQASLTPELVKMAKYKTWEPVMEYTDEVNADPRRLSTTVVTMVRWFGEGSDGLTGKSADVAFADRYARAVSKASSGGAAGGESKAGTSTRPTGSAAQNAAQPRKKPGVIAKLVEVLRTASAQKPITKEAILIVLVKEFPERDPKAMKSTIGSQIPCGLKTEKNITVTKVGADGWYISAEGK